MNVYRILLIAVLAAATALQASQAPQKEQLGSIHGIVVNAVTREPVEDAVVELTWIEHGRVVNQYVVTGPQGRFGFDGLQPANDYELMANESLGFVPAAYGQRSPADPWAPIALSAGQNLSDVRLMLTPLSTITGKVVDGAGKPFEHAQVFLLRATYARGRRVLEQASYPFATNSKGEYFFGKLGAGQYYIRANPTNDSDRMLFENPSRWDSQSGQRAGEPQGFPSSYYPGTMDVTAAEPVNLLNAEKARDINVVIAKVQTRRLSGTVLIEPRPDSPPVTAGKASVMLVPRSTGPESNLTRSTSAVAGQFDFRAVLPGKYYLVATVDDGITKYTARQSLDVLDVVRDADLRKLSITAARGFDIPGKIHFADWDQDTPPDYSKLAINLVPENLSPLDQSLPIREVQISTLSLAPTASGEFILRNIAPGDYRLVVSINRNVAPTTRLPSYLMTAYMASAQLADAEVLNGGMHLNSKPNGALDMVLATDSGAIFGRVLDDNDATDLPIRMVIVPDLARRRRLDLFNPIEVSPTGRFSLSGIPPGDYKLFAWAHVEIGAWFDAEFMRAYEDRGTPVHIEADSSSSVEVTLIH